VPQIKHIYITPLLIALLCLSSFEYIKSIAYAQGVENRTIINESVEGADQCVVITSSTNQLLLTLSEVFKEMSSLDVQERSESESSEQYTQQVDEYQQRMKSLQEKTSKIQRKIEANEKELDLCLRKSNTYKPARRVTHNKK